ncbi:MAG: hypothetical protein Kow00109_08720 [Acidobacteriota bacterium]
MSWRIPGVLAAVAASVLLMWNAGTEGQSSSPEVVRLPARQPYQPVLVQRDAGGVTHLFARNDRDVYFALGYLHARDRFFQMDVARRRFAGTLAEIAGEGELDGDIQLRTLGLYRAAQATWETAPGWVKRVVVDYTAGVNAWLEGPEFVLPPEYQDLEITQLAPWEPTDTLTVMKGIAFSLSFSLMDLELTAAWDAYVAAGSQLGFDGAALFREDLWRSAPFTRAFTIRNARESLLMRGEAKGVKRPVAEEREGLPERPEVRRLVRRVVEKWRENPALAPLLRSPLERGGSNFWVVGPQLSRNGAPLLANDPHLSLTAPSVFWECHLRVLDDPASGPMNVAGVSFPGVPGIVHGCNERICWGTTVFPMDVTDVYAERLKVGFLSGLEATYFEGEWEPIVRIPQVYRVNRRGDGKPDNLETASVGPLEGGVTYLVPRRNMGPLIGVEQGDGYVGLSVQYTGWGATREGETFLLLARARNLDEFQAALRLFDIGSQNWAYADVEGNIAYFTAGELPLREDLESGTPDPTPPWLVRDGTHEHPHEWLPEPNRPADQALPYKILPPEEMPHVVNPPWGYLLNANNDPMGVTADNDTLNELRPSGGILYFSPGFTSLRMARLQERFDEVLASADPQFDLEKLRGIQADNVLVDAEFFVPHILAAWDRARGPEAPAELQGFSGDSELGEAVALLTSWDFSTPTGIVEGYDPGDDPESLPNPTAEERRAAAAATIYSLWRSRVLANTLDATLEGVGLGAHLPDSERSITALQQLLARWEERHGVGFSGLNFFAVPGIDDPEVARDVLLLRSLREALDRAFSPAFSSAFGGAANPSGLFWGRLHRIQFRHDLFPQRSIPPAGGFTSLTPDLPGLARSGGFETLDASSHSARADSPGAFMFGSGAARRFVAELGSGGPAAFQAVPGGFAGATDNSSHRPRLLEWLTHGVHPLRLSGTPLGEGTSENFLLLPQSLRAVYPLVSEGAGEFTGLAVANVTAGDVRFALEAHGDDGIHPVPGTNPVILDLAPRQQTAYLARQLVGLPPGNLLSCWLEGTWSPGTDPSLAVPAGFFQVGDFELSRLDGGSPQAVPAGELYFPLLTLGNPEAAQVRLALVNGGESPMDLRLDLWTLGEAGALEAVTGRKFHLGPGARLAGDVAEILGVPLPPTGWLRAAVQDGPAELSGLLRVDVPQGPALLMLNGLAPSLASRFFMPQVAAGGGLVSSLHLLNLAEASRTVRIRPYDGEENEAVVVLEPRQALEAEVLELFPEKAPEPGAFWTSSLLVEANGPGLIGAVSYAEQERRRYAAALPLQATLVLRAAFGHLASVGDFFTGLALFNPHSTDVGVRLLAYSPEGDLLGEAEVVLPPGGRLAKNFHELAPGSLSGYVLLEADRPIAAQELFGTFDLRLLSVVPPTVLD